MSSMALKTPLRPGTVHVDPERLAAGQQTVVINTYGTSHLAADEVHVHLDNDGQIITAERMEEVFELWREKKYRKDFLNEMLTSYEECAP